MYAGTGLTAAPKVTSEASLRRGSVLPVSCELFLSLPCISGKHKWSVKLLITSVGFLSLSLVSQMFVVICKVFCDSRSCTQNCHPDRLKTKWVCNTPCSSLPCLCSNSHYLLICSPQTVFTLYLYQCIADALLNLRLNLPESNGKRWLSFYITQEKLLYFFTDVCTTHGIDYVLWVRLSQCFVCRLWKNSSLDAIVTFGLIHEDFCVNVLHLWEGTAKPAHIEQLSLLTSAALCVAKDALTETGVWR